MMQAGAMDPIENLQRQISNSIDKAVGNAQRQLNAIGFGPVSMNNTFDRPTAEAIKRFQLTAQANGVRLPATGELDDETRAVLKTAYENSLAAQSVQETPVRKDKPNGSTYGEVNPVTVGDTTFHPVDIRSSAQVRPQSTPAASDAGSAQGDGRAVPGPERVSAMIETHPLPPQPFWKRPLFWAGVVALGAGYWYFSSSSSLSGLFGIEEEDEDEDEDGDLAGRRKCGKTPSWKKSKPVEA